MGYMRHHAIIVTCFDVFLIRKAHAKAVKTFSPIMSFSTHSVERVSPILETPINEYYSFFIAPDGSKEGWPDSEIGDDQREIFTDWLKRQTGIDWVEVQYGDEDHQTLIVNDSDAKYRRERITCE